MTLSPMYLGINKISDWENNSKSYKYNDKSNNKN